jgi:UDP-2,4-diacetamido-2,4,6-trideoxy-beta-L-altropyranose hydrolase
MRVAFRVDSSALMGTGHLMRCLTLANELRRCGAATAFICRQHDGSVIARAEQEGHTVHRLARPGPSSDTAEDYAAWLGVPAPADAAETLLAVSGQHYDWLVVDHYGLDHEWEQRLRGVVGRLLVIDDLANRRHDCDLLLDQNYFAAATRERYRGLVAGPSCKLLLGPSYALLRPEYAQLRSVLPPRDGVVRRALIFFGGSDRGMGCTAQRCRAVLRPAVACRPAGPSGSRDRRGREHDLGAGLLGGAFSHRHDRRQPDCILSCPRRAGVSRSARRQRCVIDARLAYCAHRFDQ